GRYFTPEEQAKYDEMQTREGQFRQSFNAYNDLKHDHKALLWAVSSEHLSEALLQWQVLFSFILMFTLPIRSSTAA
ncbi:MAG: hypothetical protein J6K92_00740, partial [Oscillospiraceae bacterium]|nr:hypothetical protein [Oscillospiraceae bacterium]